MKRGKFISVDFDDTFTADPGLWLEFIELARKRGHTVFCVTARGDHELEEVQDCMPEHVEIICTNGRPKRSFADAYGVSIDIWIDDAPGLIVDAD